MSYETEWQTRKKRIDSRLKALGWSIRPYSDHLNLETLTATAVEELPTRNGPADYGLFVGGQLLGIIEAKKVTVNPQNVLEQAKRYAAGVNQPAGDWDSLRVPFLYATNGTIVWHLDTRQAKRVSRTLSNFHTPDAMSGLFTQDLRSAAAWLKGTPPSRSTRWFRQDHWTEYYPKITCQDRKAPNGQRFMQALFSAPPSLPRLPGDYPRRRIIRRPRPRRMRHGARPWCARAWFPGFRCSCARRPGSG